MNNALIGIGFVLLLISVILLMVWFVKYDERHDDFVQDRENKSAVYWFLLISGIVSFLIGIAMSALNLWKMYQLSEKAVPTDIKIDIHKPKIRRHKK